jgi:hypothetical protein
LCDGLGCSGRYGDGLDDGRRLEDRNGLEGLRGSGLEGCSLGCDRGELARRGGDESGWRGFLRAAFLATTTAATATATSASAAGFTVLI